MSLTRNDLTNQEGAFQDITFEIKDVATNQLPINISIANMSTEEILQKVSRIKPTKTLLISTAITFFGTGTIVMFTTTIPEMAKLNSVLAFILGSSTLFSGGLVTLPFVHYLHNDPRGLQKIILGSTIPAALGAGLATLVAALTDITEIDDFNLPYAGMLVAGLGMGFSIGLFCLMILVLKHAAKMEDLGKRQGLYAAGADFSNAVIPLILYAVKDVGFAPIYGTYAGLLALSGIIGYKFLDDAPFEQLLRLNVPRDTAKILSMQLGQLPLMIHAEANQQSMLALTKEYLKTLFSQQVLILSSSFTLSLGGILFTTTNFLTALEKFGVADDIGIYIVAGSIFASLVSRALAGLWVGKIGGANNYVLGALMSFLAMIGPAFFDLPLEMLIPTTIAINFGFGVSMVSAVAAIQSTWHEPTNPQFRALDSNIMMAWVFTFGTLGGLIFSIIAAAFIDNDYEFGDQHYYMFIMALLLLNALGVKITDWQLNKRPYTFDNNNEVNVTNESSNQTIEEAPSSKIKKISDYQQQKQQMGSPINLYPAKKKSKKIVYEFYETEEQAMQLKNNHGVPH